MTTRTLQVQVPSVAPEKLGFFRYGRSELFPGKVLLTGDAGEWTLLPEADFQRLLAGEITDDEPLRAELHERGFLRERIDLDGIADRVRRKKRFLGMGPHLHVVITTLRCNQSCQYCHASRTDMTRVDTDMSLETAKQVVDFAMKTPNPYLNFEFQGGEPTVNMKAIEFIVEYSREKNRQEGKILDHSLVTNFTYMTQEIADWVVDNEIWVCTSLDGPEALHNWNRLWAGDKAGNAYSEVRRWMDYINARYVAAGKDPNLWHVDALMTTTRKTLGMWQEVVDLYVELGIRNIHLRPLNPFGFVQKTWKRIGYSMDEYLDFYSTCLDYILELNYRGVEIQEGTAATFLKKILTPDDPNFVDIRSPVGSGTGQLAYNYDGSVYPSDEGRMVSAMGDEIFRLGTVDALSYDDVIGHPTVKSLAVASLLDTLPGCASCWNAPYCGVRPLHNYMLTGDLFAQRPNTLKCKEHMRIAEILFSKLDADPRAEAVFRRWTIQRPRE